VPPQFAYLDHDGILAFSHRGGTSAWPENTMPAFQHSIDLGYRYLETDVHLSADGVLYAFHDENVRRTTGVDANLADLESDEIDKLVVDGVATIPRLAEILTTWPMARVNIDTKSDASVVPTIKALRDHKVLDRVCIGSFVDRRINLCRRELGPDLCTSMGQKEVTRLVAASKGLADPSLIKAACAQVPVKHLVEIVTPQLLEFAHERGLQVHVWTIDEPDEMRRLIDLGADGIMTDQPAVLRQVLIELGEWAPGGTVRSAGQRAEAAVSS